MKIIPKLALAAVLATSVSGVALTVPAVAQKKKAEEAGGLKLSPEALKAAQAAQPVMQQKNYAAAEPLVAAVEAAAKTEDDKYIAAALRYELEIGQAVRCAAGQSEHAGRRGRARQAARRADRQPLDPGR
ncbi:hypothetical protein P0F65_05620 [Sphingomonas sp. I4]